jgi:hypothetical protein
MPLFDFYIMVDWSGGARRRGGRSDTIWIAHGRRTADTPLTDSPRSRTEAIELIEPVLERAIRSKQRVLLCFDFAYGYPVDFAPALQAATGKSDRKSRPRISFPLLKEKETSVRHPLISENDPTRTTASHAATFEPCHRDLSHYRRIDGAQCHLPLGAITSKNRAHSNPWSHGQIAL